MSRCRFFLLVCNTAPTFPPFFFLFSIFLLHVLLWMRNVSEYFLPVLSLYVIDISCICYCLMFDSRVIHAHLLCKMKSKLCSHCVCGLWRISVKVREVLKCGQSNFIYLCPSCFSFSFLWGKKLNC